MARRITGSTPKEDGYRMPAEFEPQKRIWMIWPERPDTWRDNAVPAQKTFSDVAKAISQFEEVIMLASPEQFIHCRNSLPAQIRVFEMTTNDAWARDTGPAFLVNNHGGLRTCDWQFNAWGGLIDGLYTPWDQDDLVAQKISELAGADSYRTDGFVLEGGSIHTDGQGTILTTEMCLLSSGRNPTMTKTEIEKKLKSYLNAEKVLWLKDGIDPEETNGHIDDVACFTAPGEVACIYTEDKNNPFYAASQDAYERLSHMTDAHGRKLIVHPVCCPQLPVVLDNDFSVTETDNAKPRKPGDSCIASYLNFLIVNRGVIVPQYNDANDKQALEQIAQLFPDRTVVGVPTREIVYGGGNIHCITQQEPLI